MSLNLKDIVGAALRQADASVKVASLRDAPIEDRSFARVDDWMAVELGQVVTAEPETTKTASETYEVEAFDLDDARYALKLAMALEHGAEVVEKLAIEGPLNKSTGGGPHAGATPPGGSAPVQPALFANAVTQSPSPQASAHARAAQANNRMVNGHPETDEDMQLNGPGTVPVGYKSAAYGGPGLAQSARLKAKGGLSGLLENLTGSRVGKLESSIARNKSRAEGIAKSTKIPASWNSAATEPQLHSYRNAVGKGRAVAHAEQRIPELEKMLTGAKADTSKARKIVGGSLAGVGAAGGGVAYHRSKKAELQEHTERLLKSKIAQHTILVSLGQIDAANAAMQEVAELQDKLADVTDYGGSTLVQGDDYGGSNFPDNLAVRNLTKAQARDRNTREANAYFGEPVKRDNAVGTHLAVTDGLKLSAWAKRAAQDRGFHESVADTMSELRANRALQMGANGLGGAALGGILGHGMGGGAGAALGAALGGGAGGALGHYSAKGEQAMRNRLRNKQSADRGFHESLANHTSELRANTPLQAGAGALGGAALGGMLGHGVGGGAGAALGAALGGGALGSLGYYSSKGEQAMRDRLRKKQAADRGFHESLANHTSELRANTPLQAGAGALGGAALGGMLGHGMGGGAGAALGAALGGGALGALGYHSSKGEQAMRNRLRNKQSADRGFHESLANHTSELRANTPLQAGAGALGGAALGGMLGHGVGGGAGAALGAALGGGALGSLGYYSSKGEQAMRNRLRNKQSADRGFHESLANHRSELKANVPLQAGAGALGGGALGGMLGHGIGGKPGAALGAALGGGALGALGYHSAKGEAAMRNRLRQKQSADRGFHESLANHTSELRANTPLQAGAGALGGAALGGMLGHGVGGGAGAALGAALGGGALGSLGYYSSKGEQAMRNRLRNKAAGILDTVGGKAVNYAGKGLRAIGGVAENRSGDLAGSVFRKTIQGQNALGRIGDTGKKVIGGTVLGAGALGTGLGAKKMFSNNNNRGQV